MQTLKSFSDLRTAGVKVKRSMNIIDFKKLPKGVIPLTNQKGQTFEVYNKKLKRCFLLVTDNAGGNEKYQIISVKGSMEYFRNPKQKIDNYAIDYSTKSFVRIMDVFGFLKKKTVTSNYIRREGVDASSTTFYDFFPKKQKAVS